MCREALACVYRDQTAARLMPRPIYDNLAELCAEQARWADHAAYRAKAIAAQDTAARRVLRAVAFLRLHNWDAAYADMAKANKMDATDPQVKEWLPEFERLQKFLPQIKSLDAQIAKSQNDPAVAGLLLERARVFILAGRPLLAIDDAERAFKLQPASMRARIRTSRSIAGCRPTRGRGKVAGRQVSSSWRRQPRQVRPVADTLAMSITGTRNAGRSFISESQGCRRAGCAR